jgi:4-hydroxyphenylpyruvate dioxygenase-like putative hemolysin
MTITRLDHLVLAVHAITDALAAWRHALDLTAGEPHRPARTHMQIAALPLDSDAGGAFLELVQPTDPSHRVARFLDATGEGMFSISLEVDYLDATVAQLRDRGLPVSDPEPGVYPNTRVARIPRASAHGVAVQLIERAS